MLRATKWMPSNQKFELKTRIFKLREFCMDLVYKPARDIPRPCEVNPCVHQVYAFSSHVKKNKNKMGGGGLNSMASIIKQVI